MAQHDYNLVDQPGASFRADLNNALLATVSQNSGTTEPSTMFAYQMWADTTTGNLKIRNAANNAWITIGSLGSANLGLQVYDANTVKANTSNTFTSTQYFRNSTALRAEAASTQDAIVLSGRAGGTGSYAVTLIPTTLSASRTITLPNTSLTVAGTDVAQSFTAVQTPKTGTASVSTTSTFTYDPTTHGQVCTVTLTNAITVTLEAASTKFVAGTHYTVIFKAGDTSARSFAKGTTWLAPSATLPITSGSITANGLDVFHLVATDANTVAVVGSIADVR